MRRRGWITALLVLLCIAGGVGIAAFLRRERAEEQKRQAQVARLTEQLQPLNEERDKWEEQDEAWKAELEAKKSAKPCVLLNFDSMDEGIYEVAYTMMDQYGFRGTVAFRNGKLPGWEDDEITPEDFDEMMFSGWEYALSFGEDPEPVEEIGYWERKAEEESESETETETEAPQTEGEYQTYAEALDGYIATLQNNGVAVPHTLFCDEEQYGQISEAELAQRGFTMVCVKNEESFPSIGERSDKVWRIDCGVFTQDDADVETTVKKAVAAGESVAIVINSVRKLSQDTAYDLSLTKFTSLLNLLKRMEEEGKIYVLTWTELDQYADQQEKEYQQLLRDYHAFRGEMEAAEAELNQQESEIVDSLRQTEEDAAAEPENTAAVPESAGTEAEEESGT